MKSVELLTKLANRFERKILIKHAEEVGDSAMINVRPAINRILDRGPNNQENPKPSVPGTLKATIENIIKAGTKEGGDIDVGGNHTFSAKKVNGKWTVTACSLSVSGDLLQDSKAGAQLQAAVTAFNAQSKTVIEAELARVASNFGATEDTITNHETFVDKFNFGIGAIGE